jgi:hypothetical protein
VTALHEFLRTVNGLIGEEDTCPLVCRRAVAGIGSEHRSCGPSSCPRDNDLVNTPPELSNVPVGGKGQWLHGRLLVIAVAIVGVAVFAIALIAGLLLANAWPNSDWIPVYQDVLKTSFGALAVGGLGGLAKLVFDQCKDREAAADELRGRRYRFISTLVEVIYNIETAKLVIRADRSVESWTDMVNDRIIPGCSRLADMTEQLSNWAEAGLPMFDDTEGVVEELRGMNSYFASLLDEYGNRKQALGELQLKAEEAKQTSQQTREQVLARIWNEMQELQVLGGLLSHEHDDRYRAYRSNYVGALLKMRHSLVPKTLRNRR